MIGSKNFALFVITTITLSVIMVGCDTEPPAPLGSLQDEQSSMDNDFTTLNELEMSLLGHPDLATLVRELRKAQSATRRYRDVNRAIADGYVDINENVPGQGIHYLKEALVDANFDLRHPELLLYVAEGNHLQLTSVEYVVPIAPPFEFTPPEGFTGDFDVWDENLAFGLWTLHVWLWLPNGVFADTNPLVP